MQSKVRCNNIYNSHDMEATKYPLTDKQRKKWYRYIKEYYIAIKENGPHIQGAVAAWGVGGPNGAIPCSRLGGAAVRRYPSSKVRSSGCALLEQP